MEKIPCIIRFFFEIIFTLIAFPFALIYAICPGTCIGYNKSVEKEKENDRV